MRTDLPADWRERVIKEAHEWVGTPFVHRAGIKGVGTDCGGIIRGVYDSFFGPFPPVPDYPPDWTLHKDNNERYLDFIIPFTKEVPIVLLGGFSIWKIGRAYGHAGIYVGDNKYIHAYGKTGVGGVRVSNRASFGKRPVKHFDPNV